MHKYNVFGVSTEDKKEFEHIRINLQIIEETLKAFGIYVKLVEVRNLFTYYEYYFEIAIGTELCKIERLDRDMALALASPTGTVEWIIPVPGRSLVGLRVPKPLDKQLKDANTLKTKMASFFYFMGRVCNALAYLILRSTKISK